MIGVYWQASIALAAASALAALLLLKEYAEIRGTRVGRLLLLASALLAIQSLLSLAAYVYWASRGLGKEVAAPLIAITSLGLAATVILYRVARA